LGKVCVLSDKIFNPQFKCKSMKTEKVQNNSKNEALLELIGHSILIKENN